MIKPLDENERSIISLKNLTDAQKEEIILNHRKRKEEFEKKKEDLLRKINSKE